MGKNDGWPHTDAERQSHLDGYERDLQAGERRLAELEATGNGESVAADQAREQIANARRLLKDLGHGQQTATKRPAGRSKSTR